jgi:hypothetical protein
MNRSEIFASPTHSSLRHAFAIGIALAGLFFLVCLTGVFPLWWYCGDEGFYSLAGRNVLRGLRPYRDFLFIQMPLMAYVYAAWFAVVPPSIQSGRVLAVIMATVGVILTMAACRRRGGDRAAIFAGMLWLSSVHVAYDLTAIKTQTLCHLLLAATIYALSRLHESRMLTWASFAMAAMSLAFLTRLTLVIPLTILWMYLAWECRRKIVPYLGLVAANIALLALCISFFWAEGRMWFGIYVTHHDFYGAAPWTWGRLMWTVKGWLGNQLVIAFVFAFAMIRFCWEAADRANWPRLAFPAYLLASYWAVSLAHWAQVQNYPTHQSTITAFAIVFSAIILAPLLNGLPARQLLPAGVAFGVFSLMALFFNEITPAERFVRAGKPDMLTEAQTMLRKHANEGDRLLTFNVELAVDGNYNVYPGCDMNDWSYMARVPDEVADRYHLLNWPRLKSAIKEGKAPILTLMDREFQIMAMGNPEAAKELKALIDDRYQNVGIVKRYGQFQQDLYIFKRLTPP